MVSRKKKTGAIVMAVCMMLLGTGLPANTGYEAAAEEMGASQTQQWTEADYDREWHEEWRANLVRENEKVKLVKGTALANYPYPLIGEINPDATYIVDEETGRFYRCFVGKVDGNYMSTDEDGILVTRRWVLANSGSDNGWSTGTVWMYFDENGCALTSQWIYLGHKWYYLDEKGAMQTGWTKVGDTWYYMDKESGAMQTGWIQDGWTWYYLDSSGAMQTGWILDRGTWYYLNGSGAMQQYWTKVGDKWYYLGQSGAMQTGWAKIGWYWYYMKDSGAMAENETMKINGVRYSFDASGKWIEK